MMSNYKIYMSFILCVLMTDAYELFFKKYKKFGRNSVVRTLQLY